MPVEAEVIYRSKEQIVADLIQRMQVRVPDVHVEEDGNLRMLAEVMSEVIEGVYLANQIQRDNIFIQTANLVELRKHGEQYGLPVKAGTFASGSLRFEGAGGTFLPVGVVAGLDVGGGDALYYMTTVEGTIPNPGDPIAPTLVDAGVGTLPAGIYEYAVTFETTEGETTLGEISEPLAIAVDRDITVNSIPIGGPGTIARNLYERVDGGDWKKHIGAPDAALNDNVTTSVTISAQATGGTPPEESTAERVTVAAQSEETGEAYNAAVGTILELVQVPDGITDVYNTTVFIGGTDEEDMETYRARLLDFLRNPKTGSTADLESWAEEIDGVGTATAFNNDNEGTPTNGHVTVRIAGPDGSIPAQSVIDAVQTHLDSKDIANITIHVATFSQVTTDVTVTIALEPDFTLAEVTASVEQAIIDYINDVPVGATVYRAGIYDAVFGLPGVATLTVDVPATDQTAAATEKRIPGTITVS